MKTKKQTLLWALIASFLFMAASLSAENISVIHVGGLGGLDPNQSDSIIEVGVALSGGGARGLAAIGVLKAFEEKNIRVKAIAGTSIGGVIGGLYAAGYSASQMDSIISTIKLSSLFSNRPPRSTMLLTQRQARERHLAAIRFDGWKPVLPRGLTAAQELTTVLTRLMAVPNYIAGGDFGQLPIPFATICTDIVTGDKVVLTNGSLAEAIRSTIAFPMAFTGVERGEQLLMDGGMVTPIPVGEVKGMLPPGGFVVAINSTSPMLPKDRLTSIIEIAGQASSIMTRDHLIEELALADFVIRPSIGLGTMTDIQHSSKFIQVGYETGLIAADSIQARLMLREDDQQFLFDFSPASDPSLDQDLVRRAIDHLTGQARGRQLSWPQLTALVKKTLRDLNLFEIKVTKTSYPKVRSTSTGGSLVTLAVEARGNLRSRDWSFVIEGNQLLTDSELVNVIDLEGEEFQFGELRETLSQFTLAYQKKQIDLMRITTAALDYTRKQVQVTIDEGIIYRIEVENSGVTQDWLVKAYLPLKEGQPYSAQRAAYGLDNIYGSDLFERVTLDLYPSDSGARVVVRLQEKEPTQARLGWHWDNTYQSEEFIEILNDNLFGTGTEYLFHAMPGYHRQNYYAQLRSNRIFSSLLTGRIRLYYDRIERSIFDTEGLRLGEREEKRWGGRFKIGQQISRLGTLSAEVIFEELEYHDSRTDLRDRFGMRTLMLQSLVENFDRLTFPNSGKKHLFRLSFAGHSAGGEIDVFTKYYNSIESYFPLGRVLNYHPRIILGVSRTGLPPSEKFFLGGATSFQGYRVHQLSGDKIIVLNQELRFKLPWRFYIHLRYDIGQIYASTDDIKLSDLSQGWGGALALDTPLGPFEFAYGKNETGPEEIYFRAGFHF